MRTPGRQTLGLYQLKVSLTHPYPPDCLKQRAAATGDKRICHAEELYMLHIHRRTTANPKP